MCLIFAHRFGPCGRPELCPWPRLSPECNNVGASARVAHVCTTYERHHTPLQFAQRHGQDVSDEQESRQCHGVHLSHVCLSQVLLKHDVTHGCTLCLLFRLIRVTDQFHRHGASDIRITAFLGQRRKASPDSLQSGLPVHDLRIKPRGRRHGTLTPCR